MRSLAQHRDPTPSEGGYDSPVTKYGGSPEAAAASVAERDSHRLPNHDEAAFLQRKVGDEAGDLDGGDGDKPPDHDGVSDPALGLMMEANGLM